LQHTSRSNTLKSADYLILPALGVVRTRRLHSKTKREAKDWFIRKFYITKTPGNFTLEVRFTCKNVSRDVCEEEHRVSFLNFMETLASESRVTQ
jgi:hypothetical protein